MKITAFNPLIVSKDAENIVKLFEEFGFERAHTKEGIPSTNSDVTNYDLKHPNGFRVDVATSTVVPQDLASIRMNVDDFDEAYKFLESHGFKNVQGDKTSDTKSAKSTLMVSPSGFSITLSHHIKNHD